MMIEEVKTIEAQTLQEIDLRVNDEMRRIAKLGGKVFAIQSQTIFTAVGEVIYKQYERVLFIRRPEEVNEMQQRVETKTPKPDLWCKCPKCSSMWKYSHFPKCRCGNDVPPEEKKGDYKGVWG